MLTVARNVEGIVDLSKLIDMKVTDGKCEIGMDH